MKFGKTACLITLIAAVGIAGAQGKKPMVAKPMMSKMGKAPMTMNKAEWQAEYNKAAKMMERRDTKTLFSYMSPDFVMMQGGKTMDAAHARHGMDQMMAMMKTLKASMTVTNVSGKGNMAMVTDNFMMSGMTKPDPKTHKSGMFKSWGTETATWMMMGGKWTMKKMSTTNEKMTMNGKPFMPKM